MPGLIASAEAIMRASEQRLQTASSNIANVTTPGYKRQISFSDIVGMVRASEAGQPDNAAGHARADMAQGKLAPTGNPLDIAISGNGMFALRDGGNIVYSRNGQFRLMPDGTVANAQGQVLQQAGGGDLILDEAAVKIAADGTVTDQDKPIGRIALVTAGAGGAAEPIGGGSLFRMTGTPQDGGGAQLHQGMIETSNVSIGDEMVSMMGALRQAESGAKLAQAWDDLLGRAITSFGGGQ